MGSGRRVRWLRSQFATSRGEPGDFRWGWQPRTVFLGLLHRSSLYRPGLALQGSISDSWSYLSPFYSPEIVSAIRCKTGAGPAKPDWMPACGHGGPSDDFWALPGG